MASAKPLRLVRAASGEVRPGPLAPHTAVTTLLARLPDASAILAVDILFKICNTKQNIECDWLHPTQSRQCPCKHATQEERREGTKNPLL